MKPIVFLFIAAIVIVASQNAEKDEDEMIRGLSTIFNISRIDVITCIHEIMVTTADLRLLNDVILLRNITKVDHKSLRKASCTIACCANMQGTMSGTKIQVSNVKQELTKFPIPVEILEVFLDAINICSDQVKQITDRCDVAFKFIKCIAIQCEPFIGY